MVELLLSEKTVPNMKEKILSKAISFIKDKIFPIFHNNFPYSILLNKVLYSGSHSGDYFD